MGAPAKDRRFRVRSVSVDVDIDEDLLEENGYHHEDECEAEPPGDVADDILTLRDWHDAAHGLSLWTHCSHEPCTLLTDEFRSSR